MNNENLPNINKNKITFANNDPLENNSTFTDNFNSNKNINANKKDEGRINVDNLLEENNKKFDLIYNKTNNSKKNLLDGKKGINTLGGNASKKAIFNKDHLNVSSSSESVGSDFNRINVNEDKKNLNKRIIKPMENKKNLKGKEKEKEYFIEDKEKPQNELEGRINFFSFLRFEFRKD